MSANVRAAITFVGFLLAVALLAVAVTMLAPMLGAVLGAAGIVATLVTLFANWGAR